MTWNLARTPSHIQPADLRTLAAYTNGQPLPKLRAPHWEGPREPSDFYYASLGYARVGGWGERGWLGGQWLRIWHPERIYGQRLTVDPATVTALWGDRAYVDGRGWVDLGEIVVRGAVCGAGRVRGAGLMSLQQCYHGADADGRAGFWFGFGYDAEKIEALKQAIPHVDRSWDPVRQVWWCLDTPEYRTVLLGLWPAIEAYFNQPALF